MGHKAKVILSYWRIPLYFLIAMIILLVVASQWEKGEGALDALALFVAFPGLVITLIRAEYLSIKNTIYYNRNGWPETVELAEVEAIRSVVYWVEDEIDTISDLSSGMKIRFLLFRIFGIILIAGGIVLAFIMPVIGALVIIGGATLCICANPETYNSMVSNVRMVPYGVDFDEFDIHDAFEKLKGVWTSLGTPYLARVRGVEEDAIVYGPDESGSMVVVYQPKSKGFLFVSEALFEITERLTEPEAPTDKSARSEDDASILWEIFCEVENAVKQCCDE